MGFILKMKEKALKNIKLTREEGLRLFNSNLEELIKEANNIRKEIHGDGIDLCSIINGKSGRCGEDCAFCAQSKYYKTNISEYPLLDYKEIKKVAKENEDERDEIRKENNRRNEDEIKLKQKEWELRKVEIDEQNSGDPRDGIKIENDIDGIELRKKEKKHKSFHRKFHISQKNIYNSYELFLRDLCRHPLVKVNNISCLLSSFVVKS